MADLLGDEGYDAVHVRAYGMQAATDEEILARALDENRIVVSADTDFGAILAAQEADRPSFVTGRTPGAGLAMPLPANSRLRANRSPRSRAMYAELGNKATEHGKSGHAKEGQRKQARAHELV